MKDFATRTSVLIILFAMAPGLSWAQGKQDNLVLLSVNNAQTALEYHAEGSDHGQCNTNPGRGCVRVTGNAEITFRLVSQRQCDAGGLWELDGVQLGGENSPGKPGNWGGLSATAASDFVADPDSGWANTSPARGNSITLTDDNTAVYDIWYRVSAECGGETIFFDPRAENDGTGH